MNTCLSMVAILTAKQGRLGPKCFFSLHYLLRRNTSPSPFSPQMYLPLAFPPPSHWTVSVPLFVWNLYISAWSCWVKLRRKLDRKSRLFPNNFPVESFMVKAETKNSTRSYIYNMSTTSINMDKEINDWTDIKGCLLVLISHSIKTQGVVILLW